MSNTESQIIICVPGMWRDRDELVRKIAEQSGAVSLIGDKLTETQSKTVFELQVEAHDPRMAAAFRAVGPHWADTDVMQQIEQHTLVTYLIGRGGSHGRAVALMLAAAALVKAGGVGVKIESSGIAHSPQAWLKFVDERHLFSAHEAFVVFVTDEDIYTCGMHSFGLRDAVIAIGEADDPVELLRVFTWYLFTETPAMRPGQTFSVAAGQPRYRVSEEECTQYESGELFKNQHGMWRLSRIVG